MMMQGERTVAMARAAFRRFLRHTYTRGAEQESLGQDGKVQKDEWGEPYVTSVETYAVPCQMRHSEAREQQADEGAVMLLAPTLWVAHNDPITSGDTVTNIRTKAGELLDAGPYEVESVDNIVELGAAVARQAVLRRATGARI